MNTADPGPSHQEKAADVCRSNIDTVAREENDVVPPTEQALPQIEQFRLEQDQGQGIQNEEEFRRAESGEAGGISELAAPAVLRRRRPSYAEPWATLESAESRVSGQPPSLYDAVPAGSRLSRFATKLYTVSYLIFFSIFGTLARIGLEALTVYPGAPVTTGVLWANVGGCLLMGFFAEDRNIFREEWGDKKSTMNKGTNGSPSSQPDSSNNNPGADLQAHKAIKKTIPLYVGLTTGFCGSFTSFSSFISDVFLALSNDLPNPNTDAILPRNGGYSFMAVVAVILYTVSLSLSSLVFGAHLAAALDGYTPTLPFLVTRRIVDRSMVMLGFGCWLGAIFLAIWPPDRLNGIHENWRGRAVFATVFAPLGCLLRYYVSLLLNATLPSFPLGTFAVNMFGTMILGMCFDLKHAASVVGQPLSTATFTVGRLTGCQVLTGVIDGFCGCATTVSTWIAELYSLELRHAYRYGLLSIGLALSLMVVIMGSMRWTVGFAMPVC